MHHLDVILLVLLSAVGALLVLSQLTRLPYPIVLVVGGALLGVVPGLHSVKLPSDAVLLLILPPLLFYAAFIYQARQLRDNWSSILFMAFGLLVVTMAGVALVAHALIGLPLGVAFVLGAVLSPTDPVAATAIASRLGAPRRVTAVIEGESLVNDGVALVLYGAAVGAVSAGNFSWSSIALKFPETVVGGVAIGLFVAWFISWAFLRRMGSGYHNTVLVFLCAYLTYLSAEFVGVSGVLAAVSGGIYIGRRVPIDDAPTDRIAGYSFFEVMVFLINTLVFILMGLQFPAILERISDRPAVSLLVWAAAVNLTVIALRVVWSLGAGQITFRIIPALRRRYPKPPWRQSLVIGWAGMRGAVSLAAAQAIPVQLADGSPFPGRDLILFLVTTVIFVTVVPQGLFLPVLIRRLGLGGGSGAEDEEVRRARVLGARAALERIDQLQEEDWLPSGTAEPLRDLYQRRSHGLAKDVDKSDDEDDPGARYAALQRLRRELVDAERGVLLRLHDAGEISDKAMRRVERDLDLEESRVQD